MDANCVTYQTIRQFILWLKARTMLKLPVGISSNGENKKYIIGFPTKKPT
jgi:hypothetical protein